MNATKAIDLGILHFMKQTRNLNVLDCSEKLELKILLSLR
jgi:hypothetical protein